MVSRAGVLGQWNYSWDMLWVRCSDWYSLRGCLRSRPYSSDTGSEQGVKYSYRAYCACSKPDRIVDTIILMKVFIGDCVSPSTTCAKMCLIASHACCSTSTKTLALSSPYLLMLCHMRMISCFVNMVTRSTPCTVMYSTGSRISLFRNRRQLRSSFSVWVLSKQLGCELRVILVCRYSRMRLWKVRMSFTRLQISSLAKGRDLLVIRLEGWWGWAQGVTSRFWQYFLQVQASNLESQDWAVASLPLTPSMMSLSLAATRSQPGCSQPNPSPLSSRRSPPRPHNPLPSGSPCRSLTDIRYPPSSEILSSIVSLCDCRYSRMGSGLWCSFQYCSAQIGRNVVMHPLRRSRMSSFSSSKPWILWLRSHEKKSFLGATALRSVLWEMGAPRQLCRNYWLYRLGRSTELINYSRLLTYSQDCSSSLSIPNLLSYSMWASSAKSPKKPSTMPCSRHRTGLLPMTFPYRIQAQLGIFVTVWATYMKPCSVRMQSMSSPSQLQAMQLRSREEGWITSPEVKEVIGGVLVLWYWLWQCSSSYGWYLRWSRKNSRQGVSAQAMEISRQSSKDYFGRFACILVSTREGFQIFQPVSLAVRPGMIYIVLRFIRQNSSMLGRSTKPSTLGISTRRVLWAMDWSTFLDSRLAARLTSQFSLAPSSGEQNLFLYPFLVCRVYSQTPQLPPWFWGKAGSIPCTASPPSPYSATCLHSPKCSTVSLPPPSTQSQSCTMASLCTLPVTRSCHTLSLPNWRTCSTVRLSVGWLQFRRQSCQCWRVRSMQ